MKNIRKSITALLLLAAAVLVLAAGSISVYAAETDVSSGAGAASRKISVKYDIKTAAGGYISSLSAGSESHTASEGKELTLTARSADEEDAIDLRDFDFVRWEFNWNPVFLNGTSKTSENVTFKVPTTAEVGKSLTITKYFVLKKDHDLTALKSLSGLKNVSPLTPTIKKGSTQTLQINFDKNYYNGKIRIHFYTNVKDGSTTAQSMSSTKQISSSRTTVNMGQTKNSSTGAVTPWYAGDCYITSIELFDLSGNLLTTVTGKDARINSFHLTITGGAPVTTRIVDKGTTDLGIVEEGENTSAAAGTKGSGVSRTEKTITSANKEDLAGAAFAPLKAYAKTTTKNSVTVRWSKVSGAAGYIIYGNKCGKTNKFRKLGETTGTKFTQKKLKKATYYKYLVVAYKKVGSGRIVITSSRTVHATTKGGSVTNYKAIKLNKSKVTLKLSGKKTYKLKVKAKTKVNKSAKVKKHRTKVILFESSNPAVATVTSAGKITAKSKGTAIIYAYAQNGVCKSVAVTVK